MTEAEAQAALAAIAFELSALEDRLQQIRDRLPESPDREAMWEHRMPYDVATEIHGTIECLLVDTIRPAIQQLEISSRITAEELRRRFEE